MIQQTFSISTCIFEYICWKFAGRLLDRVNTPLVSATAKTRTHAVQYLACTWATHIAAMPHVINTSNKVSALPRKSGILKKSWKPYRGVPFSVE